MRGNRDRFPVVLGGVMNDIPVYRPCTAYTACAIPTAHQMTIAELSEMVNGWREKVVLPFLVICENVEVFMDSRTPRERLLILDAYITLKENPMLGSLGMEPGLYAHPGPDRIYYHITTKPGG